MRTIAHQSCSVEGQKDPAFAQDDSGNKILNAGTSLSRRSATSEIGVNAAHIVRMPAKCDRPPTQRYCIGWLSRFVAA